MGIFGDILFAGLFLRAFFEGKFFVGPFAGLFFRGEAFCLFVGVLLAFGMLHLLSREKKELRVVS